MTFFISSIRHRRRVRRWSIVLLFPFHFLAIISLSSFVVVRAFSTSTSSSSSQSTFLEERPPCFYRAPHNQNRWQQRIELADLKIGQQLHVTTVISEKLDGVTGPKIWVDCGVGRYKPKKKQSSWKIQTAMLRLGNRGSGGGKLSVARKKVARLRQKPFFPVYVSRIRLAQDQFEVVLDPEAVCIHDPQPKLLCTSSLQPGQEITGTIVRNEPYGAIVSVDGYNRPGLLHIQRVADLFGKFIHPQEGWKEAGLERKTRVRLQVLSNEKKGRLFLDFTEDVKQPAITEKKEPPLLETKTQKTINKEESPTTTKATSSSLQVSSPQEEASTTPSEESQHHENDDEEDEDEEDEDDWDEYDEDRDIEDALGLGTY